MAKQKTTNKKVEKAGNAAVVAIPLQNIRKWNLWFAALLAVQAIAIIIIGTTKTFPVTTQYLAVDTLASEAAGSEQLAAATRHLFDIRFAWVVALFLLVFGVSYLLAASLYRVRYERRLQAAGMSDVRWAALGVGGGAILAAVGLLSGIYEVATLLALFGFIVVGCLAALAGEELSRRTPGKKTLLAHLLCGIGVAGVALPLVMLLITIGGAWLYNGHIPGYLYGIYVVLLLFFVAAFLLTHYRIARRGKWADTFMTERAYMVLGFVGASMLAWQMFAGALQP